MTQPTVDSNKCNEIIQSLLKVEPRSIKYLDCLACLHEKTNQIFDAIKVYRKILKISPDNEEAKANLRRLEDRDDVSYIGTKNKKDKKKK